MAQQAANDVSDSRRVLRGAPDPFTPLSRTTRLTLLLLTWVAGWVDALCFLGLGKVFTSFMSGNFLFLGIALGQGERDFLLRAAAALAAFLVGAAAATVAVSRLHQTPRTLCSAVLAAETIVLGGFAVGWLMMAEYPASGTDAPVVLLAVAAFAMGLQAAAVSALNIPGVATNALTGTFTLIARILAQRMQRAPTAPDVSLAYLLLLCAAYGLSAGTVVLAIGRKATILLPVALLAAATLIARRQNRAAGAVRLSGHGQGRSAVFRRYWR